MGRAAAEVEFQGMLTSSSRGGNLSEKCGCDRVEQRLMGGCFVFAKMLQLMLIIMKLISN